MPLYNLIIFEIKKKIAPSIVLALLLSYTSVIAQLDSIVIIKEKLFNYSKQPNFSESDTTYINLLNDLSYRLRYSQLDSMELLAKNALELSASLDYKKGTLEALTNFSAFHLYNGNTEQAIQYGEKTLEDKEIHAYPSLQMRIYNQLGQAHFIKQEYPLTYTNFLKALELGNQLNDDLCIFRMNMNLGTMFSLLEDYTEGLGFYEDSEIAVNRIGNNTFKGMVKSNMGYLFIQTGEFERAEQLLLESIEIFKSQKVSEWLAFTYSVYAQLHLKLNDFEVSRLNFKNALDIQNSLNDIKGKADVLYGLSKANIGLDNLEIGEKQILESLELYKSFNLKTGLEKCYRVLYELKKNQGKISEALDYLELSDKLANDISKEKNKRNLNMLNAKFNSEKEKENLRIKSEVEIGRQRKFAQWALVAFLIALFIALLVFRASRREKALNKKLENQAIVLNENQKVLENINNSQDRLFSIVGHDLRGPIISLKELLTLYIEDPDGKEYFEKFAPQLRDDLEQVQFTMDNLLHWGKTQMQGFSISKDRVAVKEELEYILQLFRKDMERKQITVKNEINKEYYITADVDHFKVIFRNLLSNALKFTPEKGKISLSTEVRDKSLVIKVSDTGVGMSDDILKKLFKSTEHFSTFGTNAEKGTGLGLSLVNEMVTKNQGKIHVHSKLHSGTVFSVELPLSTT